MTDPGQPAGEQQRGALLDRVVELLGAVGEVVTRDDVSVVVRVETTRASVRILGLSDDLDVLTVTQLVALDLPNTDTLRDDVERHGAELSFGSLRRSDPDGVTTDVLLYYTFPVGGIGDVALLTVLHVVLSTGADIAQRLVGG
ncbi:hypothetical protein GCM10009624_15050 [Gordonia sinesedis]